MEFGYYCYCLGTGGLSRRTTATAAVGRPTSVVLGEVLTRR